MPDSPRVPRRRVHRHPPSGGYWISLAHPLKPGASLTLRAPSTAELAAKERYVDELREARLSGRLPPEAIAAALARVTRPAPTLGELLAARAAEVPAHLRSKADAHRKRLTGAGGLDLTMPAWEFDDAAAARLCERLTGAGYASKTVWDTWYTLRGALSFAVRRGKLERLPCPGFRLAKERAFPAHRREALREVDELRALVRAARDFDELRTRRYKPHALCDLTRRIVVMTLFELRQGEACALGWDDVDFARNELHVRRQAVRDWHQLPNPGRPAHLPKKGSIRTLVMHPDARGALLDQRAELEQRGWYRHEGPVFPGTPGRHGGYRTSGRCVAPTTFREVVIAAGLPGALAAWVPHSLRHSGVTLEAASGAGIGELRARSGHRTVSVLVDSYLHGPRRAKSRIPRLDPHDEEGTP